MAPQGKYWLITYKATNNANEDFDKMGLDWWESRDIIWSRGQLESGEHTGYTHWQFVVCFAKKVRMGRLVQIFGQGHHYELTICDKANEYVEKDDTSLGCRWEVGKLPFKRNSKTDWEAVKKQAIAGDLDNIPASVFVCHYSSLRKISMDYMKGTETPKQVKVFWGPTGTGKSRRAWQEAGMDAYPKSPTTKFWDGYRGEENVVMDEFSGQIEVNFELSIFDVLIVA